MHLSNSLTIGFRGRSGPRLNTFSNTFVRRTGNIFYLNGRRFRFVGANKYPLITSMTSQANVQAFFSACRDRGIKVVRTWCFDSGNPPTDTGGNFRFLDYPIDNNLITNNSFESNTTGWTLDTGFTRSNDRGYDGSYSIKQVTTSGFNGFSSDAISVSANTTYTVTFWYYIVSRSGFGSLLSIRKGSDGTQLYDGGLLEGTAGQWVRKQVQFSTGSETTVRVRCSNFSGNVTMYYDKFHFNVQGTPYLANREATFAQLDMVLAEARNYGVKLILSLADNPTFLTKKTYCTWANSINNAGLSTSFPYIGFFTSEYCKDMYKDFVDTLVNRTNTINSKVYKDDDTIFAYELGNELRTDRDDPSGINTLSSANIALLSGPRADYPIGDQVIDNTSFESGTTGWTVESAFTRVNTDAKEGSWSIRQNSSNGTYDALALPITVYPGISYTWSVWYKLTNTPGDGSQNPTRMVVGTTIGGNQVADGGYFSNASGWTQKTLSFTNSATTRTVYLNIHNWGGTNVGYFDNITLTVTANTNGWIDEMSTYIKSVDPNHLVGFSSGSHGYDWVEGDNVWNGSYYGVDYGIISQRTNIDYVSCHFYPTQGGGESQVSLKYGQKLGHPNTINRAGIDAQLAHYVTTVKGNGKAFLMGETGFIREVIGSNSIIPLYPRVDTFDYIFDTIFNQDGDGVVLWHGEVNDGGSYSVNIADTWNGDTTNSNFDDRPVCDLIEAKNTEFSNL